MRGNRQYGVILRSPHDHLVMSPAGSKVVGDSPHDETSDETGVRSTMALLGPTRRRPAESMAHGWGCIRVV